MCSSDLQLTPPPPAPHPTPPKTKPSSSKPLFSHPSFHPFFSLAGLNQPDGLAASSSVRPRLMGTTRPPHPLSKHSRPRSLGFSRVVNILLGISYQQFVCVCVFAGLFACLRFHVRVGMCKCVCVWLEIESGRQASKHEDTHNRHTHTHANIHTQTLTRNHACTNKTA